MCKEFLIIHTDPPHQYSVDVEKKILDLQIFEHQYWNDIKYTYDFNIYKIRMVLIMTIGNSPLNLYFMITNRHQYSINKIFILIIIPKCKLFDFVKPFFGFGCYSIYYISSVSNLYFSTYLRRTVKKLNTYSNQQLCNFFIRNKKYTIRNRRYATQWTVHITLTLFLVTTDANYYFTDWCAHFQNTN